MRCPSCGTENAQDSRFCGGCGAKLGPSAPRVAPTQKISDDAGYRPSNRHPQNAPGFPPGGGSGGAGAVNPQPAIAHSGQPGHAQQRPPTTPVLPAIAPTIMVQGAPRPPTTPVLPAMAPIGSAPPVGPGPQPQRMPAPVAPPRMAPTPVPVAPAPVAPSPPAATSSAALPVAARRPWGLIIAVLVVDACLAVAGSWMLSQGLRHPPGSRTGTTGSGSAAAPHAGTNP